MLKGQITKIRESNYHWIVWVVCWKMNECTGHCTKEKPQPTPKLIHLRIQVYLSTVTYMQRSAVVGLKIAYFERGSKLSSVRKVNLGRAGTGLTATFHY